MMMSQSPQKLAAQTEVSGCVGYPQCWCSQCKLDLAAFGSLTATDFQALKSAPAMRLSQSQANIAYMGDGHRCKRFPCPVCHPGRSQRDGLSSAVTAEMLSDWYAEGAVAQQLGRHHGHEQAAAIMFGDGGHICRRLPCPICGNGRSRSTALEVLVGC